MRATAPVALTLGDAAGKWVIAASLVEPLHDRPLLPRSGQNGA
jgi:hypothetical protein